MASVWYVTRLAGLRASSPAFVSLVHTPHFGNWEKEKVVQNRSVFLSKTCFLSRPSERRVWELKGSAEVHSSLQLCFLEAAFCKASEILLQGKTVQIK